MPRTTVTLLILALAPACTKEPVATTESDTGTDTDTTGGSSGDTTGTTTESTSEVTTGAMTEAMTGGEWLACLSPQEIDASYGFNFGLWAPDFDPSLDGSFLTIDATCVVTTFERTGGAVAFDLTCSEGQLVDVAIPVTLSIPADMPVILAVGDAVRLRFSGHGFEHHTSPGDYFAIHDSTGAGLLVAGFDEMWGVSAWNQIAAPLIVESVDNLCPLECEGGGDCFEDGTRRDAIRVDDGAGNVIAVLDRRRDTLAGAYDIAVASATWNQCLNCFGTYRIVITSTGAGDN